MKNYYYLHVSKTAGRFFYRYVLKDIISYSESSDIGPKYLFPKHVGSNWTHHGWHDLISDDTYLMCSLRDPVEAIVSYKMHHNNVKNKAQFFKTIDQVNNIQSRSFLHWDDNKVKPGGEVHFDKELILSRLNRMNLVLDSKDININTYNDIKKKIVSDLRIKDVSYNFQKADTDEFRTYGVKELCESLTEAEKDRIKEVNYMDVELYEAAKSLFFPIEYNSNHVHVRNK